jgi:hypothetical protein
MHHDPSVRRTSTRNNIKEKEEGKVCLDIRRTSVEKAVGKKIAREVSRESRNEEDKEDRPSNIPLKRASLGLAPSLRPASTTLPAFPETTEQRKKG